MQAAWRPDPSGRNDYRWWDGVAWSDAVSNRGVITSDPAEDRLPPPSDDGEDDLEKPSGSGAGRSRAEALGRPPIERLRLRKIVPAILAGLIVAAAVVGFIVVRRGPGTGLGIQTVEVAPGGYQTVALRLERNDMVRIRIEPEARSLDVQLGVLVNADLARRVATRLVADYPGDLIAANRELAGETAQDLDVGRVEDLFFVPPQEFFTGFVDRIGLPADGGSGSGRGADAALRDGLLLVESDDGGPGAPETNWFVVDEPGTYLVVVWTPGAGGAVRVISERALERYPGVELFDRQLFDADPFFVDPAFYSAAAPYVPDPSG